MKNVLRLVVTETCDRVCAGCCMRPAPFMCKITFKEVRESSVDTVIITGGEPLLLPKFYWDQLSDALAGKKKILYSANKDHTLWGSVIQRLSRNDGITYTIHELGDLKFFHEELYTLSLYHLIGCENLWLNVVDASEELVEYLQLVYPEWNVRQKIWTEDCPVPINEDLRQLVW